MNLCVTCGENFGSVGAFDRHRVGDYPQKGPAEYADRLRAELVPWDVPWQRSFGRCCLTPDEMRAKGLAQNSRGQWSIASALEHARGRRRNRTGAR